MSVRTAVMEHGAGGSSQSDEARKTKGTQLRKEKIKPFLLAGAMNVHVVNLNKSTKVP